MPGDRPRPHSPLTPPRGVIFHLSQLEGGKPKAWVGCSGCHFHEPIVIDDLEADHATVVRVALQTWGDHMCEDTYPSESPDYAAGDRLARRPDGATYVMHAERKP